MNHEQKIRELQDTLLDLNGQIQQIQALADSEKRDLTDDELGQVKQLFADFESCENEIDRRQRIIDQDDRLRNSQGRKTESPDPEPQNAPRDPEPQNNSGTRQPRGRTRVDLIEDRGKWGWRNLGEMANAVRQACVPGGHVDPRLIANAPTTYGSEGVGADGGFLVAPDFREAIMEKVTAESSLLSRTDMLQTSSNSLTIPKDETTPWQSSGGVQAYWMDEGKQITQSKPALKQDTLRLNKLAAIVPVTDELLDDASALDSYLRRKVPAKMDFSINLALVDGDGAGKPIGILQSDCLVSVAKETASPAQSADTIVYNNIVKMWSRLYAECRPNAIWLINQDIETQLRLMAFDRLATDKIPVYLPPGGMNDTPYGSLFGRPVVPSQACKTLGDKGDVILADMSQYLTVMKVNGVRSDVSIHLWFDYDQTAYRFIFRVAGQPWWSSSISALNGSTTYSCFVTLDERA